VSCGLTWVLVLVLLGQSGAGTEGGPPPRPSPGLLAQAAPTKARPTAVKQPPAPAPAPASAEDVDKLRQRLEELAAKVEQQAAELEAEKTMRAVEAESRPPEEIEERPMLRLYGFAEAGLQRMMPKATSVLNFVMASKAATFVVGNLNLYIDAQPSENWSSLIEMRLTNEPNGLMLTCAKVGPCVPQSTFGYESSSPVGWSPIRWGSIIIERAYIQWRYADLLKVRLGRFLTPFGIWNIDHGSPTLISLMLPNFQTNELIPTQQTGLELLGAQAFGDYTAGYHAFVSNGRTVGQLDFTDDKMFGGRLYLRRTYGLRWGAGLSGMTGRNTNQLRVILSLLPYRVGHQEVWNYREHIGGADLSLDAGPLRLRYEFAIRRVDYKPGKRDGHYDVPNTFNADRLEWNTYVLGAYQLPWLGLEPFVYVEVYRVPTFLSEGALIPSVGFNIRFTPFAQLKTQYMMVHFAELPHLFRGTYAEHDVHVLSTRLVLAF
jgi:hypothetical protein